MSYGMDGWNHDNDLVRRKDVMDSLVKEYNRRFSLGERNGLHLAWIEKAVNDVPFAQPTQNTRVNSNNALDTISRAAAIDAICNSACGSKFCGLPCDDVAALKALPSAQPEIIRCKDCKHNQIPSRCGNAICEIFYGMTKKNGFCHRAERRT